MDDLSEYFYLLEEYGFYQPDEYVRKEIHGEYLYLFYNKYFADGIILFVIYTDYNIRVRMRDFSNNHDMLTRHNRNGVSLWHMSMLFDSILSNSYLYVNFSNTHNVSGLKHAKNIIIDFLNIYLFIVTVYNNYNSKLFYDMFNDYSFNASVFLTNLISKNKKTYYTAKFSDMEKYWNIMYKAFYKSLYEQNAEYYMKYFLDLDFKYFPEKLMPPNEILNIKRVIE